MAKIANLRQNVKIVEKLRPARSLLSARTNYAVYMYVALYRNPETSFSSCYDIYATLAYKLLAKLKEMV